MPLTAVSAGEAEAFIAWLSERSGATYRLPTAAEWTYAARASGEQPSRNYNCKVLLDNKLIKGLELLPVNSGTANGWGLKNYLGNAREWVRGDAGYEVRGGAYTDAINQCVIEYAVGHSGQADEVTGFRLLRELG